MFIIILLFLYIIILIFYNVAIIIIVTVTMSFDFSPHVLPLHDIIIATVLLCWRHITFLRR